MLTRAAIAATLIVACGVFTRGAAGPEHPAGRVALSNRPLTLREWKGMEAPPFADDVLNQLGADDYINRRYGAAEAVHQRVRRLLHLLAAG